MSLAAQLKSSIQAKIEQIPDGPQKKSILRLADATNEKEKEKKESAGPRVQKPDSQKSRRPKIKGDGLSGYFAMIDVASLPGEVKGEEESLRNLVSRLIDYAKELDE